MKAGPACYFISYLVIVSYTLLPVVVAVLLENFTTATRREKDLNNKAALRKVAAAQVTGTLDPLFATFLGSISQEDFEEKVENMFWRLDVDNSGCLNFQELFEGFRKMDLQPAGEKQRED